MCVPPWVAGAFADQARVRAAEEGAAKRCAGKKKLGLQACLDEIAELPDADRAIAEQVRPLVLANAPADEASPPG